MVDDPLVGRTLGGHRIEAVLGRGGMGVVYRARHERLNRVRALKVLLPELVQDRDFRDRFEREWRLAASIDHPNIVDVYDAGEADGHLYIAMRLIEGPDLSTVFERGGPVEPSRCLHIVEQVAGALDAAHAEALVHRDVTPRNILLAEGDHAYLADFGVARRTTTEGLTRQGVFVGNLDYAAPEQIENAELDGRTDVYALGGVLYTCVCGVPPYERDSDFELATAHLRDPPPVPSAIRPELPKELDRVVATAMAKSPDERYQTCGELVEALRAAVAGPAAARAGTVAAPPEASKPSRRRGRRKGVALAAAILLVAAGGAAVAATVFTGDGSARPPVPQGPPVTESFDHQSALFPNFSDTHATGRVVDGSFHITPKEAGYTETITAPFSTNRAPISAEIRMKARRLGGPRAALGFACFESYQGDRYSGYDLEYRSDGYFSIVRWLDHSTHVFVVNWARARAIRLGTRPNELKGECILRPGAVELAMWANGKRLIRTHDRAGLKLGNFGFFASSVGTPGAEVAFDDFVLQRLA